MILGDIAPTNRTKERIINTAIGPVKRALLEVAREASSADLLDVYMLFPFVVFIVLHIESDCNRGDDLAFHPRDTLEA